MRLGDETMKYTIPYEDTIQLPHIKEILNIDLKTGEITKEQEDLVGKVIVFGEYTLDNSEDVMEFTHEIPISLLVDDTDISPIISFSNFEYELVRGRSVEIMFDLDVALETREDKFQKEMDDKLDEAIGVKRDDDFESINEELNDFALEEANDPGETEDEEIAEVIEVLAEETNLEEEYYVDDTEADEDAGLEMMVDLDITQEENRDHWDDNGLDNDLDDILGIDTPDVDDNNDLDDFDDLDDLDDYDDYPYGGDDNDDLFKELEPKIEKAEVELEDDSSECHHVKVLPSEKTTQFDVGFISNTHDKFTTYKVLLLDEDEYLEDILEVKGLSKDLIVDEFDRSDRKVVLKIDDE